MQPILLIGQVTEDRNWCRINCEFTDEDSLRLAQLYDNFNFSDSTAIDSLTFFPIRFAVIQEDSSLEITKETFEKVIEDLNTSFEGVGFAFYLHRVDLIEKEIKLEDLSNNFNNIYDRFSNMYDMKDIITVYVLDHSKEFCTISDRSISCSRTGGFSYILSNRTNNVVVSRFDLLDQKIIAHELGHFFGLYHTFEEALFGKDDFNPEHCHLVGDRICDTPPDPGALFEIYVNYSICEMKGFKTKEGHEYKPKLENFMSYYKPCYLRAYQFTPQQKMVMKKASKLSIRKKFMRK